MPTSAALSRRDFLKWSGLGAAGLLTPHAVLAALLAAADDTQQGRVTARLLWTYDQPSILGNRMTLYWRDQVVPVTDVVLGSDETAYNRIWYQIGDQGFAYSGELQPVHTRLNTPLSHVPAAGVLGEVSVPYTDALEGPQAGTPFVYRLYYETVHWIQGAVGSPADGKIWYKLLDDKWNKHYFAPGEHFRLLSQDELAPLSPQVPDIEKYIEVRLGEQLLLAYESGIPVFATRVASGAAFSSGVFTTPSGEFTTYHKRPTRHMAAGDITASGFDLPGVPWVMYITEAGISLHGTYWHNDFGHPRSHGCLNLTPAAAKWLFRWTKPTVPPQDDYVYDVLHRGTQVLISA